MSLLLLRGRALDRVARAGCWVGCGVLVLGAHGGALAYLLSAPPPVPLQEPAAIMIELAEVPVAPPSEPVDVAPGPQMVEAPKEVEEEVKPDEQPEEEVEPPPPEPIKQEEPLPEVTESPAPDIEVPLPPPAPLASELTPPEKKIEPKKEPPKKKPKPREKNEKPPAPRTSAAPQMQAENSERIAAPTAGAANARSMTPANWRSRLMAHLNRHKRYPTGESGSGKARVAFTINRAGQVLSARLVGSSGNSRFDEEAVAMVRRASPVPAPPPEVPGGSIAFTVPVDFTLR
ncbi:energy transducer TonB family protein [Ancylobacter oerskovii]|uniref:Energy transducer TonB n=1 Tax=Ancylobacter oerskovii TaxID=459519 RepID=A0ABW4YXR1_9HYPH|nr:energy transducer TonB [Ancylobacter oerskovii]MBS7541955.1 TonB family protein [Ancylobacter oerskovii]